MQVHPEDVSRLAYEMEDIVTNRQRQLLLREKGLEQAKRFSWERCAALTWEVYNRVACGK